MACTFSSLIRTLLSIYSLIWWKIVTAAIQIKVLTSFYFIVVMVFGGKLHLEPNNCSYSPCTTGTYIMVTVQSFPYITLINRVSL